jgi:hypothetical protein
VVYHSFFRGRGSRGGRTYAGYARGWQCPPHRGRFFHRLQHEANYVRGRGLAAKHVSHARLNPASMPARAAQGSSAGAVPATNTGDVMGSSNIQSGTTVSQTNGIVGMVAAQNRHHHQSRKCSWHKKEEKQRLKKEVQQKPRLKTKKFCFRCYKPGHGKVECKAELL